MGRLICLLVEEDRNSQGRRHADGPVVGQTGARFGGAAGRRRRAAVELPEQDDADATQHQHGDQVVGQTSARFPSLSRWRQKQQKHNPEQQDLGHQDPGQQDSGQQAAEATGAQQPPSQRPPGQQQVAGAGAAQLDVAPPVPQSVFEPVSQPDGAEVADWDRSKETPDLVRPYFWTGGRTAAQVDLAVETLLSATGRPPDPPARPEHCTILGLCATPRSVAELAALLKMPLGVARVVLGDLAATGSVSVHRTGGSADTGPDVALMQRVLAGLQRL